MILDQLILRFEYFLDEILEHQTLVSVPQGEFPHILKSLGKLSHNFLALYNCVEVEFLGQISLVLILEHVQLIAHAIVGLGLVSFKSGLLQGVNWAHGVSVLALRDRGNG